MKKIIIISLLALVLALAACTPQPTGNSYVPFIGGQDGIDFKFIEGQPSTDGSLFENQEFAIGIELVNKGESDIKENSFAQLRMSGFDAPVFDTTIAELTQDLNPIAGARKLPGDVILDGQIDYLTFEGLKYLEDIPGTMTQRMKAELCYDYSTKASASICLAGDTSKAISAKNPICEIKGIKNVQSSSGPIQVMNLQESPAGTDKIRLSFTIIDTGADAVSSNVYRAEGGWNCNPSNENSDYGIIDVRVSLPDSSKATIDCQGSGFRSEGASAVGEFKLPNTNQRILICTVDGNIEEDNIISSMVDFELNYRYHSEKFLELPISDYGSLE